VASKLRVVAPNEAPAAPAKRHTVTSAASDGTRRDLLVAMRSRVATAVEDPNTPARDLAALTRRLMELARDIEALDAAAEQEAQRGDEVGDGKFDSAAI
jgi:hypothetical protein